MWLSSGNWNNSNQPDISVDPSDLRDWADQAKKFDRDWHIVVNHAGLARTYEAFLQNDFRVATQAASQAAVESEAAIPMPTAEDLVSLAPMSIPVRAAAQRFDPLRIPQSGTRKIRIQPILTPDNYYQHVLDLIRSARKTFYMQTQYIHPSDKEEDQQFADLINAVVDLQNAGVVVRIILSQWQVQGSGGWLEKLQATGIDLGDVRIQNGVHNKGIVVDSQIVMLGSQNWSGDGVLRNRDASLIIDDREAAAYYEQIFLHDWAKMASQSTPQ